MKKIRNNSPYIKDAYMVLADHDASIEKILEIGKFVWAFGNDLRMEDYLNTKIFPATRRGISFSNVEFISAEHLESFDWAEMGTSIEEVLNELNNLGYRAAEIRELLAFGMAFPYLKMENPIVAFGSIGIIPNNTKIVTGIQCHNSKVVIGVTCPENIHDLKWRLAVVAK